MTNDEHKPLVLLVEDCRDLAHAVSHLLKLHGFRVVTADSIDSAVSYARSASPTVLLAHGFYVGVATSIELLDSLRQSGWSGPAILVSGKLLDDALAEQCRVAGFSKILLKPAPVDELLSAVHDMAAATATA